MSATILALNSLVLACDPFLEAPPAERLRIVGQELQAGNSDFLKELGSNRQRQQSLLEANPGAAWLVGQRLAGLGLEQEAASLYVRQIMSGDPAFAHLAFRDWLALLPRLPGGLKLLSDEGQDLFARLDRTSPLYAGTAREFSPRWLEAMEQDGRTDEAAAFARTLLRSRLAGPAAGLPERPLGEPALESWLLYQLAAPAAGGPAPADRGATPGPAGEAVPIPLEYEALAAYCLGHEARLGHLQAAGRLAAGQPTWFSPAMQQYLAAKLALVNGLAGTALDGFADLSARLDGLVETGWPLVRRTGLDALVKDVYVASRQARRLADGSQVLLAQADWFQTREPVLAAYARELAGRLRLQDSRPAEARKLFLQALDAPLHPQDRQRVVWYLIQTHLEETHTHGDRPVDRAGLLSALGLANPDGFFTDLQADCLALFARNGDRAALEELFSRHAATLEPALRWRLAYLLALQAPEPSGREPHIRYLLDQSGSVYYHAMACWLAGLPLDLGSFLARNQIQAAAGPVQPLDQEIRRVAQSFRDLDMLAQAGDFAWTWRRSLDQDFVFAVAAALQAEGRFKAAQRLTDSVRLRLGHPDRPEWLRVMYPLALPQEMAAATAGLQVPPVLWYGLVRTESAFETDARSRVGARGLSQLMPATAAEVAAREGIVGNPDDPAVNLRLGAVYLDRQFRRFGSWPQALGAYNAGPGRMGSWIKDGWAALPWGLAEQSPFAETRDYVRRIIESALIYAWLDPAGPGLGAVLDSLMRQY